MPCHTVWTITVTYLHLRGAVSNIFQPTFLCPGASAGISSVRQRFPVPGCRLLSWMYFFWVVPLRFPVPKVNPDWCGRRMRTIYFAAEHPFKSVLQVYTFIRTCCERSPPKILELLRSQNHPIPRDEAGDKKNGTMSSKNRQFVGLVHFPWFSYIYIYICFDFFFAWLPPYKHNQGFVLLFQTQNCLFIGGDLIPQLTRNPNPSLLRKLKESQKSQDGKTWPFSTWLFVMFSSKDVKRSVFFFSCWPSYGPSYQEFLPETRLLPTGNTQHLLWTVALLLQG